MRILMLGWELPPHNSGGLGVVCYQLCKALAQSGADIDFVLPYQTNYSPSFMRVLATSEQSAETMSLSGLAYETYKYTNSAPLLNLPNLHSQQHQYEVGVSRIIKRQNFDIIHAHDWLTFRAALQAKLYTGWPLVVHIHSIEADRAGQRGGGNPLVREIESLGLMMADHVIAVSERTKQAIVTEYQIPAEKIEVIHNCIDPEDLEPLASQNIYSYLSLLKSQGYKIIVNVGRQTIQKGLPNLLDAAKIVIEELPKTILLMVGAGEQYFELIDQAAQLRILKNTIFTGFQRGQAWRDAFSIADLFVMPSVSEPFGLTPLEALYYDTPVLVSKQAGINEVLHNSLRVDFWDTHEMANQIAAVLQTNSLKEALTVNGKQELYKLTWNQAVGKIFDVYTKHAPIGALV